MNASILGASMAGWRNKIDQSISFDGLSIILFCVVVPFLLGSSTTLFQDGDVGWHIAAGQWMIDHRQVPFTDPFSYPAFGKPWIAHEWLSELFMGAAYNILGFAGVAVLMSAALAMLALFVGLELRRWLATSIVAAIIVAMFAVIIPFFHARPMVLTWPLLAGWTLVLMRARDHDKAPPLWLAAVMTLWVNMHASFALGLLLIGPFALEALLESRDRVRAFIDWGVFGSVCLLATLINPHSYTALLIPLGAFASPSITLIQEFKPTDMTYTPGFELAFLLVVALCFWRGARLQPMRVLILLGLLHLALAHMRHQVLFLIVAALLLARPLGRRTEPSRSFADVMGFPTDRRWHFAAVSAVVVLALAVMTSTLARPPENSFVYPNRALAHVSAAVERTPVLNSYKFGGPLILRGVRPFIDGRTDAYGEAFVVEYKKLLDGDDAAFANAQARWGFRWTLVAPSDDKMLAMMDRQAGWRRIYEDPYAVIHLRN
ncbi:MAG: hypothetical protein ACJ8EY_02285 [Sphingomicrobium sp.]